MYVFHYFHLRKYIIQHTYVPQCAAKDTRDMKRQELKRNHRVTVERPFLAVGSSINSITPTQQQYKSVTKKRASWCRVLAHSLTDANPYIKSRYSKTKQG